MTGETLLQTHGKLDELCRGGAGDATDQACEERNQLDAALFAKGYCYVGN